MSIWYELQPAAFEHEYVDKMYPLFRWAELWIGIHSKTMVSLTPPIEDQIISDVLQESWLNHNSTGLGEPKFLSEVIKR